MEQLKKAKALLFVGAIAIQSVCSAAILAHVEQHYDPMLSNRAHIDRDETLQEAYDRAYAENEKPAPNYELVNTLFDMVRRKRATGTRDLNDAAAEQLMWLAYGAGFNQRALDLIVGMSAQKKLEFAQLQAEIEGLLQNESLNTTIDSQMTQSGDEDLNGSFNLLDLGLEPMSDED